MEPIFSGNGLFVRQFIYVLHAADVTWHCFEVAPKHFIIYGAFFIFQPNYSLSYNAPSNK
jgi:hypothetical protein